MGLRRWWEDPLGLKAMAGELAAERALTRDMLNKVIQITQRQVDGAVAMTQVLERHFEAYNHDGLPPQGRHWSDAAEAEAWEAEHGDR